MMSAHERWNISTVSTRSFTPLPSSPYRDHLMAAGITDRRMRMEEVVATMDAEYEKTWPKTRGPYRKRAA